MTAADVVTRLCAPAWPLDRERVEKAKQLAARYRVNWADVLALLTPKQRKQVAAT